MSESTAPLDERIREALPAPSEIEAKKLGQPEPESNLVLLSKSTAPQQTQPYRPGSWWFQ